jgi:hypothetical protein
MPYIRFGLIVPGLHPACTDDPNCLMNPASCTKTRIWLLLLRLPACPTLCFTLPCSVLLLHGNEDVSRLIYGTLPHYVYKFSSYHIEKTPSYTTNTNMYSFKYNQQDATLYSILYYCQCSTCFGRFFRPSSGSQKLYTQHRVYAKLACCYR